MKNHFYLSIGIFFCIIYFYNKILRSRLPRDLEDLFSYDLIYLLVGAVSILISIIVVFSLFYFRFLRKLFEEEIKIPEATSSLGKFYEKYKDKFILWIIDMTEWIKLPFKAVYEKTLLNKDMPNIGTFYITLGNIYTILVNWFGKEILVFVFIFLPRLLISIFFFIDVVFYHYIKNFYYSLPLIFINLLFQVVILQGLADYAMYHVDDTWNYLDIDEKEDGFLFKVHKEWLNTDVEEDKEIIAAHFVFCYNCYLIVAQSRRIKQDWNPWMTLLTQGFYLLSWVSIFVYYFEGFWLLTFLVSFLMMHLTLILFLALGMFLMLFLILIFFN